MVWFLISTEPGRAVGCGTSAGVRTSGPPVSAKTIAFISLLPGRPDSACTRGTAQGGNGSCIRASEVVHEPTRQRQAGCGYGGRARRIAPLPLGADQR